MASRSLLGLAAAAAQRQRIAAAAGARCLANAAAEHSGRPWLAPEVDVPQAGKAARAMMRANASPVAGAALLELWRRCTAPADVKAALRATEAAHRWRAATKTHSDFPQELADAAVGAALRAGASDLAALLLLRRHQLGLATQHGALWHAVIGALGERADLQGVLRVWRAMPKQLASGATLFHLARSSLAAGRADVASAFVEEFENNGAMVPAGVRQLLELQHEGRFDAGSAEVAALGRAVEEEAEAEARGAGAGA